MIQKENYHWFSQNVRIQSCQGLKSNNLSCIFRVFIKACWGLGFIIFYAFVSTYLWMMRWMRGLTLTRVVSLVGLGWWQWCGRWTIMIDVTTQIWFWAMIFGIKFLRPPVIICWVVPLAYNQQHTYNLCKSCFKRWIWCFTNSTSI